MKPACFSPRLIRLISLRPLATRQEDGFFLFSRPIILTGITQASNRPELKFLEEPRLEAYGKVVVFRDAFGNKWDLIEPLANHPG